MKSFTSENLTQAESTRRYILAAAIIGVFFAVPGIPAWVTFVSLYPFLTAVLHWDPINATIERIEQRYADSKSHGGNLQGAV